MGLCGSKTSDEPNPAGTGRSSTTPPTHHRHHPKARRRYHNKRYPANPSSKAHATVSPLTSLDDVKEVLSERRTPRPPRRRTNNSSNNSIDGPKPKPKKKGAGPAATSFSFDKSGQGERTHTNTIPLASDIWSITNSAIAPPRLPAGIPNRPNRAAAIPLTSEIWSITDGPPTMAPPMSTAAAIKRPGLGPFALTPAAPKYCSPGKRDSPMESVNRFSGTKTTTSPIKIREAEFNRMQNSYGSPGSRRERRGPYLAGREREREWQSSFERERRPVTISPQKRERERERERERYLPSSVRRESSSQWSAAAGSIEMRRRSDVEEKGSGRRQAVSPAAAAREEDRLGKRNVRGGASAASPGKENGRGSSGRRMSDGRNDGVEQRNESSDSSLSIEGFVFL